MEELKCVGLVLFALWGIVATIIASVLARQCREKDERLNQLHQDIGKLTPR